MLSWYTFACSVVLGTSHRSKTPGLHLHDRAEALVPTKWLTFLQSHGSKIESNRVFWFADLPSYRLTFPGVSGTEGSCDATFIVTVAPDVLTFNLFAPDVLEVILSSARIPEPDELFRQTGKVWAHALFESKCLALGISKDGTGTIHDVATQYAREHGGCGCLNKGTLLMRLALDVMCKFGQTKVVLEDASSVQCSSDRSVQVPFGAYRALTMGTSWYESFGFNYNKTDADVLDELRKVKDQISVKGAAGQTFGQLAQKVWKNDCASLESTLQKALGGTWDMFKTSFSGHMAKHMVCE